ncbi:hypothetical protein BHE74_00054761 [Ensete ventricosum]|nr:hypothetical protein BHE74_00054761 [Ensete ventricosum]
MCSSYMPSWTSAITSFASEGVRHRRSGMLMTFGRATYSSRSSELEYTSIVGWRLGHSGMSLLLWLLAEGDRMDDCPERGDGVPRKRSEGRAHQRSVSHGQRELLEGIIVEDIRQATCVNHDPLHQCIADTDRDHQRIIMVGEFSLSCLEGDLGLVSFAGAFIRNGLCVSPPS